MQSIISSTAYIHKIIPIKLVTVVAPLIGLTIKYPPKTIINIEYIKLMYYNISNTLNLEHSILSYICYGI